MTTVVERLAVIETKMEALILQGNHQNEQLSFLMTNATAEATRRAQARRWQTLALTVLGASAGAIGGVVGALIR